MFILYGYPLARYRVPGPTEEHLLGHAIVGVFLLLLAGAELTEGVRRRAPHLSISPNVPNR